MALPQHERLEERNENTSEESIASPCFLYDRNIKPTSIESFFGEPYHVKDKYSSHQITLKFIITLSAVYIVEGCIDWVMIAVRYYGTQVWNIGPSEMQNFRSITTFPWTVKLIYGLTIDALPLFGYKRKSWLLIFSVLGPISILICIIFPSHYYIQLTFMTINALSICFCDVIADALTVERTEFKSHSVATRLQSLAWGSRYVSSIAGILVSTRIELSNKPKDMLIVYWLYFFVSLSIIPCSILLPEKRIGVLSGSGNLDQLNAENESNPNLLNTQTYSIKTIIYLTFQTLCRKSIFYPLMFTFILRCTPASDEALDYYLIYKLGFSSVWIGYLKVAGGVAFLLSIIIITYQSRKSNVNFSLRKLSFVWTLIAALLPFMTLVIVFGWNKKLGIPNIYFMVSDKIVVQTAVDILQMCVNILYARICPPGIEAVFMTVLTSVSNIGLIINYQISSNLISALGIECTEDPNDAESVVCDFTNLWLLIVIVNLSTLIPLILIKKVPNEQQLQYIGERLKNSLSLEIGTVARAEMVKGYWICMDYIWPVLKNICCLCNKKKDVQNNENQIEMMISSNNQPATQQNNYAEIEMR